MITVYHFLLFVNKLTPQIRFVNTCVEELVLSALEDVGVKHDDIGQFSCLKCSDFVIFISLLFFDI